MKQEELIEILEKSLSMEEEGHKMYAEGARRIKNSLGRKMLERLAQDELNHIERIKEIFTRITDKSLDEVKVGDAELTVFEKIFRRMREQMDEAVEDLTEVGVDDQEIIDVALNLESHGYMFYEEAARKADNPKVKEFYTMLAAEEKSHYELLQKTKNYLEDPSLFYGMGYH
jgi:rubrerythrin